MNDTNDGFRRPHWEKRATKRAKVDYDLKVDVGEGEASFYTGLVKDISSGGLFIVTETVHALGTVLKIRFHFPGSADPIEIEGKVKWRRDPFSGAAGPEGVGVEFLNLPGQIADRVNEYIADHDVLLYDEGYWPESSDRDW